MESHIIWYEYSLGSNQIPMQYPRIIVHMST